MLIHFDYDGVLVDSFDRLLGLAQMVQRAMGNGRPPRAEDLRTIPNLTLHELGRRIGIPEVQAGRFAAEMFGLLREDPEPPAVWDGIPCILNRLSRNHTLVILTGNAREAVQRTLVRSGLRDCVREIIDGQIPGSKAEKILSSMKRYSFAAKHTFMIGDALSDILEGYKAGVQTIAVTWGYQLHERLAEGNPNFIIENPAKLLEIFSSKGSINCG